MLKRSRQKRERGFEALSDESTAPPPFSSGVSGHAELNHLSHVARRRRPIGQGGGRDRGGRRRGLRREPPLLGTEDQLTHTNHGSTSVQLVSFREGRYAFEAELEKRGPELRRIARETIETLRDWKDEEIRFILAGSPRLSAAGVAVACVVLLAVVLSIAAFAEVALIKSAADQLGIGDDKLLFGIRGDVLVGIGLVLVALVGAHLVGEQAARSAPGESLETRSRPQRTRVSLRR